MRVSMRAKITGTRDGADWPSIGGEVDLPESEAADLITTGLAVEVATAAEPEKPAKRGRASRPAQPETR